jgi:hypothetical protein
MLLRLILLIIRTNCLRDLWFMFDCRLRFYENVILLSYVIIVLFYCLGLEFNLVSVLASV